MPPRGTRSGLPPIPHSELAGDGWNGTTWGKRCRNLFQLKEVPGAFSFSGFVSDLGEGDNSRLFHTIFRTRFCFLLLERPGSVAELARLASTLNRPRCRSGQLHPLTRPGSLEWTLVLPPPKAKKPTWWNTRRHSTTPAYSSNRPPGTAGLPFS